MLRACARTYGDSHTEFTHSGNELLLWV